jgi:glycosyltransferase involved in cell wall biosynthesis
VNAGSEVARVITEAKAGIVVSPEKSEALAKAILSLSWDTSSRYAMGAQGRDYARRQWDREQILPAFEARLLSVAGQGELLGKGLGHSAGKV